MNVAPIDQSGPTRDRDQPEDVELRWIVESYDIQSRVDSIVHNLMSGFLRASSEVRSHIGDVIDQAAEGLEDERSSLQAEVLSASNQLEALQQEQLARRPEQTEAVSVERENAWPRPRIDVQPDLTVVGVQAPQEVNMLILGVEHYRDAAAFVRAIRQAPSVTETDIVQFQPGELRLLLIVSATAGLVEQMTAASPRPLALIEAGQTAMSFQVIGAT